MYIPKADTSRYCAVARLNVIQELYNTILNINFWAKESIHLKFAKLGKFMF